MKMRKLLTWVLSLLLVIPNLYSQSLDTTPMDEWLEGKARYDQGDFAGAIAPLEEAVSRHSGDNLGTPDQAAQVYAHLRQAYIAESQRVRAASPEQSRQLTEDAARIVRFAADRAAGGQVPANFGQLVSDAWLRLSGIPTGGATDPTEGDAAVAGEERPAGTGATPPRPNLQEYIGSLQNRGTDIGTTGIKIGDLFRDTASNEYKVAIGSEPDGRVQFMVFLQDQTMHSRLGPGTDSPHIINTIGTINSKYQRLSVLPQPPIEGAGGEGGSPAEPDLSTPEGLRAELLAFRVDVEGLSDVPMKDSLLQYIDGRLDSLDQIVEIRGNIDTIRADVRDLRGRLQEQQARASGEGVAQPPAVSQPVADRPELTTTQSGDVTTINYDYEANPATTAVQAVSAVSPGAIQNPGNYNVQIGGQAVVFANGNYYRASDVDSSGNPRAGVQRVLMTSDTAITVTRRASAGSPTAPPARPSGPLSVPAGSVHAINGRGQIINPGTEVIFYNKEAGTSMTASQYNSLSNEARQALQGKLVQILPSYKWDPGNPNQPPQQVTVIGTAGTGRGAAGAQPLGAATQPQVAYAYANEIENVQTGLSTTITISNPVDGFLTVTKIVTTAAGERVPALTYYIDQRLLDPANIADGWDSNRDNIPLKDRTTVRLVPYYLDDHITTSLTTSADGNTVTARIVPDATTDITRQTVNYNDDRERQVTETITRNGEIITATTTKGVAQSTTRRWMDSIHDERIEIDLSTIESMSISTTEGTSTMRGFDFSRISSNQELLHDVLREFARNDFGDILQPPTNGVIGEGDDYLLLSADNTVFFTVRDGNVVSSTGYLPPPQADPNLIRKVTVQFSGDVNPPMKDGRLDRDGIPDLQEEAIQRTYINGDLFGIVSRLNDDANGNRREASTLFNSDGTGSVTISMVDSRGSITSSIINYNIIQNDGTYNPRSSFHNSEQLVLAGCDNCFARDGNVYREQGGRLVEVSDTDMQTLRISNTNLDNILGASEVKLAGEAEADNRLTASQESHQQRFADWEELTGTAISTGNFFIYFMGKTGHGAGAQDFVQWWNRKIEEYGFGGIAQSDLIRESICNVIDKYTGWDTRLPGTDRGNYFIATPQGFLTAGAFINPTKQQIIVPDPSNPAAQTTKYNYIVDFKVNLDIPRDPTAAYQDPRIRDRVGVNIAVRQRGQSELFPTYLLEIPGSSDRFVEVQRGTTYYYQNADGEPLGPIIIAESSKDFEEACIIFNRRPFFAVGLESTNLQRYGFPAAVCSPFKIVGGEAESVEQATQDLLRSKKEQQEGSERAAPGTAVANDDTSLY